MNAISDRLFFPARSSSPPPSLLFLSRGQMPAGLPLAHPGEYFITWMPVLTFIFLLCTKPDCQLSSV